MSSVNDIRAAFLDFFKRHGHEIRPSSSLVPHNDPTLMFTNAGMNQFKNVFTGAEKVPYARAATSQKCVRAGGKHNDLDNVGYTARHHTFFEMLGNFSFGDYFKETAIDLAWELLTKDYRINPEKLCVTVYHDDDVAWNHWKKITGFPDHKIIRISTNDNFWSMGDTGPCGPCSEIFYDHGDKIAGGPPGSKDADGDRFTEIWNLVFMQYEQLPPLTSPPLAGGIERGRCIDLPKPSIDTGMGLERISAVMQGVHDNYEIDLFRRLIDASRDITLDQEQRMPHRVIADHIRSCSFLIADGVLPSNEGRGYVLRRIMRRAMRYCHQLRPDKVFFYQLVPVLIDLMGNQYPELKRAESLIKETLKGEEERFKDTLGRGLKLLEEEISHLIQSDLGTSKVSKLPGEVAFKLYDTYGFPLDLTEDILKSRGIGVDTDGFEKCMEGQREMARAAWSGSGEKATGKIWFEMKEQLGVTEFDGYERDEADSRIFAIVKNGASVDSAGAGDEVYLVLDHTPFYGESGGQVGDTGTLSAGGKKIADIVDTQKPLEDFIVHKAKLAAPVKLADNVHAAIDSQRRDSTRANHSATHLLHKALRDQLGEHVTQKGSLVAPDRLRFDFSHNKPVSREELAAIEKKVNQVIWLNTPVVCKEMAPDDAIQAGAMALFGEKYGERVRVLSMGEDNGRTYSTELCGGTHVRATGDIGMFKIVSEGSVAAGIRRIEAVTGEGVRRHLQLELSKQHEQLQKLREDNIRLSAELAAAGKASEKGIINQESSSPDLNKAAPEELFAAYEKESDRQQDAIQALQEENKKLGKELANMKKQQALSAGGDVKPEKIGNIQFIGKIFDGLDPKELRGIAEGYLKQIEPGIVVVGTKNDGKASVVIGVDKFLTDMYSAVTLVQAAIAEIGGKGGGGRPEMAQGGGPDGSRLEIAVDKIRHILAGN